MVFSLKRYFYGAMDITSCSSRKMMAEFLFSKRARYSWEKALKVPQVTHITIKLLKFLLKNDGMRVQTRSRMREVCGDLFANKTRIMPRIKLFSVNYSHCKLLWPYQDIFRATLAHFMRINSSSPTPFVSITKDSRNKRASEGRNSKNICRNYSTIADDIKKVFSF